MTTITVWQRLSPRFRWEHNHISDGWSRFETEPTPISKIQRGSWPQGKWRRYKAYLINHVVIYKEEDL